jgi:hypothetical protein
MRQAQDQIQALFVGERLSGFEEGQQMVQPFIADYTGLFNVPANKYDGACASSSSAIRDAFMLIAGGFYDVVLLAAGKVPVLLDELDALPAPAVVDLAGKATASKAEVASYQSGIFEINNLVDIGHDAPTH